MARIDLPLLEYSVRIGQQRNSNYASVGGGRAGENAFNYLCQR